MTQEYVPFPEYAEVGGIKVRFTSFELSPYDKDRRVVENLAKDPPKILTAPPQ